MLELLPEGVPVLCTPATANDRVIEDIQAQLGAELVTQRGPLARKSLALQMLETSSQPERMADQSRAWDSAEISSARR